jgi:uncharacterized repeat protein (TIGR03803 family)
MKTRLAHSHLLIALLCLACIFPASTLASDTILFSFTGRTGAHPFGALISDGANLYGTTYDGGVFGAGTIFELVQTTSGSYSEIVLYSFSGDRDGGFPIGGLIRDSNGALYGTTSCGGSSNCVSGTGGFGVVFRFSPAGYEPLHTFTGGADGGNPAASLTFDKAMNLYGTTMAGGRGTCEKHPGCGVVFELSAANDYHAERPLYAFTGGADGAVPKAPVIFNAAENTLYGTTYQGGSGNCAGTGSGCGVVFRLSLAGSESVLHRFTGKSDGSLPIAPLIFDSTNTMLFGAASGGGSNVCPGGCGVVFRLSASVLTRFNIMHTFAKFDGARPTGGLALDTTDDSFYGTTFDGGVFNLGVIYNLETTGAYSLIHSFAGSARGDGANPYTGLLLETGVPGNARITPPPTKTDCPSKCRGTTVSGGSKDSGTVYSD